MWLLVLQQNDVDSQTKKTVKSNMCLEIMFIALWTTSWKLLKLYLKPEVNNACSKSDCAV